MSTSDDAYLPTIAWVIFAAIWLGFGIVIATPGFVPWPDGSRFFNAADIVGYIGIGYAIRSWRHAHRSRVP